MTRLRPCITCGHIQAPKLWLFDMDDTLYCASEKMFHDIHVLMDAFIRRELQVDAETANDLRKNYWEKYGVTFLGLWLNHGIDPHRFLSEVHQIDISSVSTKGQMRTILNALPGQKALFTNAPVEYAEKIVAHLGLQHSFDYRYRAEDMKLFGQWHPKPSLKMFKAIVARHRLNPAEVCLVDDNLNNLKLAKQAGLQTVLCQGWHHHGLKTARPIEWIDAYIAHPRELLRITSEKKKPLGNKKKRPVLRNPYA